jgi:putative tryptophan/tyrosine transport system substrate-binding protein
MAVIGWLSPVPGTMERYLPSFAQGLAETGYVVGRNVTIESREGDVNRPVLAADLVRRHVTVIVAVGNQSAQAAKAATQTIPIAFGMGGDPIEVGLVASLNRPSGNLTGVAAFGVELAAKRLELLHKLVPAADPIAMLAGSQLTQLARLGGRFASQFVAAVVMDQGVETGSEGFWACSANQGYFREAASQI